MERDLSTLGSCFLSPLRVSLRNLNNIHRGNKTFVQRRPPEAPVRNGVLELVDNVKRGRGRPKLTWVESVKRDLKDWNISKEIALDRSAWRLAINVPEP